MKAVLALLDLVPSWLWAVAVALLMFACTRLHLGGVEAREAAAAASRDLLAVQLTMRTAVLDEMEKARAKEAPLLQVLQEADHAVTQARLDLGAVVAASDERLRKLSRPVRLCRADASADPAAAAGDGQDGAGSAGLRGVAGGDLLVIDEQARAESARHAATAKRYAEALKKCVNFWGAAAVATGPD